MHAYVCVDMCVCVFYSGILSFTEDISLIYRVRLMLTIFSTVKQSLPALVLRDQAVVKQQNLRQEEP